MRSLVIVLAFILTTPVAAMSQSNAVASVCAHGSGPACQASGVSIRPADSDSAGDTAVRLHRKLKVALTDPGTLVVLGAALVSLGLWTRRVLPGRRATGV